MPDADETYEMRFKDGPLAGHTIVSPTDPPTEILAEEIGALVEAEGVFEEVPVGAKYVMTTYVMTTPRHMMVAGIPSVPNAFEYQLAYEQEEATTRSEDDELQLLTPFELRQQLVDEQESTGPRRYRRKPIVVEALKLTGYDEFCEALAWINENTDPPAARAVGEGNEQHVIEIITREGSMYGDPGDYIVREPFSTDDRKFYPCKPEIFEAGYEAVVE